MTNNQFTDMWKGPTMNYFKLISQNLAGNTKQTHKRLLPTVGTHSSQISESAANHYMLALDDSH